MKTLNQRPAEAADKLAEATEVEDSTTRTKPMWRVLAAVLAIGLVFGIAGRSLAPSMPTTTWLLWCAGAACALLIAAIGGLMISLNLRQFVLRKGGTDVQWLAFSSDPEGLVSLRKSSRSVMGQGIHSGLVSREIHDGQ